MKVNDMQNIKNILEEEYTDFIIEECEAMREEKKKNIPKI